MLVPQPKLTYPQDLLARTSKELRWNPPFRAGKKHSPQYGCGSKLNHQGTAGFSPSFHLPGFHFGYICLTEPVFVFLLAPARG